MRQKRYRPAIVQACLPERGGIPRRFSWPVYLPPRYLHYPPSRCFFLIARNFKLSHLWRFPLFFHAPACILSFRLSHLLFVVFSRAIDVQPLITHRFSLAKDFSSTIINEGFRVSAGGGDAIKVKRSILFLDQSTDNMASFRLNRPSLAVGCLRVCRLDVPRGCDRERTMHCFARCFAGLKLSLRFRTACFPGMALLDLVRGPRRRGWRFVPPARKALRCPLSRQFRTQRQRTTSLLCLRTHLFSLAFCFLAVVLVGVTDRRSCSTWSKMLAPSRRRARREGVQPGAPVRGRVSERLLV